MSLVRTDTCPLGIVGIVTAFNFPVAVWAWNSALAAVCGDSTIWKPSSQTPLTAIATIKIAERICRANDVDPALFSLVIGDGATVGERLINDPRIMGEHVNSRVYNMLAWATVVTLNILTAILLVASVLGL